MKSPIIVALDVNDLPSALLLAKQFSPTLCRLKVGLELFISCGPLVVETLHKMGFEIFLDLKLHDIPTTVAHALKACVRMGVWMTNVHALGGKKMLAQAKEIIGDSPTKLIGVTVLTSFSEPDLKAIGINNSLPTTVQQLATHCYEAGLDGIVCSAADLQATRALFPPSFLFVTPGVRPLAAASDDQVRVMTPKAALDAGSHYLVIGRPITQAPSPRDALNDVARELHLI